MISLASVKSRRRFAWATIHRYYGWLFRAESAEVRQELERWLLSDGFALRECKEFNRSLGTCMDRLARRLGYGRPQVDKVRSRWTRRSISIEFLISDWVWRCDEWVNVDRRLDIERVLGSVPTKAARILLMRFVWGYAPAEVAQRLGLRINAVNRAVTRLRKKLGAELAIWAPAAGSHSQDSLEQLARSRLKQPRRQRHTRQ